MHFGFLSLSIRLCIVGLNLVALPDYHVGFVSFKALQNVQIIVMPNPVPGEKQMHKSFILTMHFRYQQQTQMMIHVTKRGSKVLQKLSPQAMLAETLKAIFPDLKTTQYRKIMLSGTRFYGYLITKQQNGTKIWALLTANQKLILSAFWSQPVRQNALPNDGVNVLNSIKVEDTLQ